MNRQTENIAIIGGGLVAWWLLNRKAEVVPTGNGGGPTTVPSVEQGGAAIAKIYDSYGQRTGGRIDQYWGDIVPSKSYLGREADLRSYFLDPGKAVEHFNLHGIEFGNWMNQQDRVNFHYATMVSLADIAKALGAAQSAMGLNQKLQLSFGARGKGGRVKAFYQFAPTATINLTKTKGRDSFAHEYGHALDEHLQRIYLKKRTGLVTGQTTNRQTNPGLYPKDSVEYLFEQVFHTLYWKEDGSPTAYYNVQSERSPYYNQRAEVWARCFERYIEIKFEEKGIVNRWAINPKKPALPPRDLVLKAEPWIRKIVTKAFEKNHAVGPIFPEVPGAFYECNNGTYTERNGKRACTWHGGLKSGEPIATGGGGSSFVQDVPLSQIQSKPEWFQNRADAYSTRSVEAIVSAVLEGRFIWSNLDPIQLWKGPGGVLYILSGHSRKEAFKRLADMGVEYQGRRFDTIPAKVETGISLDEAKTVARQSNTLSTPETALERAAYYLRLRKTGDFTMRQLEDQAKRTEGRNANKVLAFSFLSTGGKTYNALQSLQNADAASFANIETVAQWIGNARKALPQLTNSHENELYDWLVQGGGYGTRPGQINSELAFKNELQKIIFKRTEFGVFNQNEPLNIQSARYALPAEAEFNAQVAELQRSIANAEKQKKEALRRYAKDASPAQMAKILEPIEAVLRRDGQELQRLILKKAEILEAAKNQGSLFGIAGRRRWRA